MKLVWLPEARDNIQRLYNFLTGGDKSEFSFVSDPSQSRIGRV